MNHRPLHPSSFAPVLLLAGMIWIGTAHAQGHSPAPPTAAEGEDIEMEFELDGMDFEFDEDAMDFEDEGSGMWLARDDRSFRGPGGLSGPAPRDGDRMQGRDGEPRMHRRMIIRRGGPAMGHGGSGMRGGMRGMRGGMQGMHGGMKGMRGGHAAMGRQLELSERQQEQMAELHESTQRRMIAIHAGLEEAKLDLQKQLRADEPNKAQIEAIIDRAARLRADAQKARIGTRLEAHSILTPEQRAKMKGMRGGMGGHGGPGPRGGKRGA